MLSASPGSLSRRYRMAFSSAAGIASGPESDLSSNMVLHFQQLPHSFPQATQRIIKLIDDPLLQRNDCVVSDGDVFWTNFGAAFGNVAVANPVDPLQVLQPVLRIQRMHLQCRHIDKISRADEFFVFVMVAQDVANILAEETLDALAEFLDAVNVRLLHPPASIGSIGRAGFEFLYLRLHAEVPG